MATAQQLSMGKIIERIASILVVFANDALRITVLNHWFYADILSHFYFFFKKFDSSYQDIY
jgi:hypothetical protein